MPFDVASDQAKIRAGQQAYQSGLAAEDVVRREYLSRGYKFVADRWRSRCGEIDLIFLHNDEHVFVEVKKARTLDVAATRLSHRQLCRIAHAAEDYLCNNLKKPFATMRLDLAMVVMNGQVALVESLSLS